MRDRSGRGWRAELAALVVATLTSLAGSTALADSRTVNVENVRVGFQERYKVGTWTPIWIQLKGGIDGFTGFLQVVTDDQDGTPTVMTQPVQVGPGGTQRVTAYARPGSLDPDFAKLLFIDAKTERQVIPDIVIGNLNPSNPPDSLAQDDYQVLALGHPAGVELISGLPGFNADKNTAAASNGRAREVVVAKLLAIDDLLPGRWYGFDAVDVVVVDTNDKEMLATLSGNRGEALRQWVQRGGHLVVAVSSNWQAVNEGLIGEMLPVKVNGQVQVTPFDSLESFTGGSHQVAFENAPAQVAKFEEIEARGGKVIASTLSTPLVVRGPYGFGRVTVIGLDIDAKPFSGWPDRALFYVKALDLKASTVAVDASRPGTRIMSSAMSDLSTRLRETLDQFQGVTLIPFAWVAGFIVLYILLIGPGDYFFLKKVLKRMELTWITFPTIVLTVSLLAYYAAYFVKGTDLRVNKIDVIDIDQEAKLSRGVSWVNVFSPRNRDYSIKLLPVAPNHEIPTDPSTEVATPPGTEVLLSWFGVPEEGLRGMNSRGQGLGFGNRGYFYGPIGKAEELEKVRIEIWSTKAFLTRTFGPAPAAEAVVESDLQPSGSDRLAGTITNKLPVAMKETILVYGKQVYYKIGRIEPGQTFDIESSGDRSVDRSLSEHLREELNNFLPQNSTVVGESGAGMQDKLRADLVREILFHQADATGQESISSRVHHDLDLTGQLALGRPMLVAEVDRPGTQLLIDGKSGSAKTEQTTVLRVILPLKKEGSASKSK
jgi:hypothetical protein